MILSTTVSMMSSGCLLGSRMNQTGCPTTTGEMKHFPPLSASTRSRSRFRSTPFRSSMIESMSESPGAYPGYASKLSAPRFPSCAVFYNSQPHQPGGFCRMRFNEGATVHLEKSDPFSNRAASDIAVCAVKNMFQGIISIKILTRFLIPKGQVPFTGLVVFNYDGNHMTDCSHTQVLP